MTREQAILAGALLVKDCKEQDVSLLATGEMGIGNTTTASAVASVLLGCEPEAITGWGAGLSDEGLARKKAAISPRVVYISPLIRARRTAEILFPETRLVEVENLKEMCFGVFQGRNYIEMEKDPDYIAWVGEDCTGRCPGGETKAEFTQRTCEAFCRLLEGALAAGEEELVILAHGGTQMALMEQYGLPKKDYYSWCGPNGGGYLVTTDAERWHKEHTLEYQCTVCYERGGQA